MQDVTTRWNSTYEMLKRFLRLKDAIQATANEATLGQDTRRHDARGLTDDEWFLAQELVKLLEPLANETQLWCGEKCVSISLAYPVLHGLNASLNPTENDLPALHTFKTTVQGDIKRRFEMDSPCVATKIPVVVCALGPRFKPSRTFPF